MLFYRFSRVLRGRHTAQAQVKFRTRDSSENFLSQTHSRGGLGRQGLNVIKLAKQAVPFPPNLEGKGPLFSLHFS